VPQPLARALFRYRLLIISTLAVMGIAMALLTVDVFAYELAEVNAFGKVLDVVKTSVTCCLGIS
jgi:hypothetical protein